MRHNEESENKAREAFKDVQRRRSVVDLILSRTEGQWEHSHTGHRIFIEDLKWIILDLQDQVKTLNSAYFAKCGICGRHPSQCEDHLGVKQAA